MNEIQHDETKEILFVFEPCANHDYLVNVQWMDDVMFFKEQWRKQAQYTFRGREFTAIVVFNMSYVEPRDKVLNWVIRYIEQHVTSKK